MLLLKYFIIPFLFGVLSYLYSRWFISLKKDELFKLLIDSENKLKHIMDNNVNGWTANSKFILESLKRIEKEQEATKVSLNNEITALKVQIATLNVKSGVFGFVGSALAIIIAIGLAYLENN